MKKALSLVLALVMALALVACGGGSSGSTSGGATAPAGCWSGCTKYRGDLMVSGKKQTSLARRPQFVACCGGTWCGILLMCL